MAVRQGWAEGRTRPSFRPQVRFRPVRGVIFQGHSVADRAISVAANAL